MTPLDDPTLRDHLARRVGASSLTAEERNHILGDVAAGRTETRPSDAWTLGGRWLGFAAAALSLLVVAVVVLKPPTEPGPVASPPGSSSASPPATSVGPTEQPISAPRILSAQELSDLIGGDRIGDVVLAYARITHTRTDPKTCPPPEPCFDAVLEDVSGHNVVAVGWRTAPEGEGTRYGNNSFVRWLTPLSVPAESGLSAFKILAEAVEYLGPVVETTDGQTVWTVGDVQLGDIAHPAELYAVEGWLVATSPAPCKPPNLDAPPEADTDYWCGRSWLTQEPTYTVSADRTAFSFILDGLHAQWDAYDDFAPPPIHEGPRGWDPRFGTYLVRSVGCPSVVMGDCPVWSMVGRLDNRTPPETIGDFPSEIDGERVLTTDEALWHVANSGSAEPFLVGGRVTIHDVDCVIDPDLPVTPLLEQCDGGYRMAKEGSDSWGEFRLVVEGSVSVPLREQVVLRVHSHDPRAADCPENYRASCERAIVVDEVVWTAPNVLPFPSPNEPAPTLPARSDAILTADQLAELALDPIPAGRVLLARASVDLSAPQPADVRCVDPFCTIGLLNTAAANVAVFVNSGPPRPNTSEVQAFLHLGDALEYVGSVAVSTGTTNVAWSVEDVRLGLPSLMSTVLYPVEGWLVEPVNDHECPEPPDAEPDFDYLYWCGSSWLSEDPVYLDPRDSRPEEVVAGALHVQRSAYGTLAVNPYTEGRRGRNRDTTHIS
jgi:hypothetical protein